MDLNLVIPFLSVIIGLISIFLGIWIAGRFEGKLKTVVILLIATVILFVARGALKVFNCLAITGSVTDISCNLKFSSCITDLLAILLILFAILNMKQMISGIDKNHKGK